MFACWAEAIPHRDAVAASVIATAMQRVEKRFVIVQPPDPWPRRVIVGRGGERRQMQKKPLAGHDWLDDRSCDLTARPRENWHYFPPCSAATIAARPSR